MKVYFSYCSQGSLAQGSKISVENWWVRRTKASKEWVKSVLCRQWLCTKAMRLTGACCICKPQSKPVWMESWAGKRKGLSEAAEVDKAMTCRICEAWERSPAFIPSIIPQRFYQKCDMIKSDLCFKMILALNIEI